MAHCVWVSVWAQEGEERSQRASGWLQYQQGPDGSRKINRGCVWDWAGERGKVGEREGARERGETQAGGKKPKGMEGVGAQASGWGVASGQEVPKAGSGWQPALGVAYIPHTAPPPRKREESRLANGTARFQGQTVNILEVLSRSEGIKSSLFSRA